MIKSFFLIIVINCALYAQSVKIPRTELNPGKYICYKAGDELLIDGKLQETDWEKCEWTNNFVDIRGYTSSEPKFRTRVKMLWNKEYLFIAAELEEHDIWAVSRHYDDTLIYENNFEMFIDPDGDTGKYCEIQLNAMNTIWDLLMIHPYRDEEKTAISSWDIKGLKSAVHLNGSLNNVKDRDSSWTIELAVPWKTFNEITGTSLPPEDRAQWRINFCRIEWPAETSDISYIKKKDNNSKSSDFWVWSPQGLVNMHYPEMWGYVQFSGNSIGSDKVSFIENPDEAAKWYLRKIYYAMRIHYNTYREFTADPGKLHMLDEQISGFRTPAKIELTSNMFEVTLESQDGSRKMTISNDGLISIKKH